jgi:hypothetical protein
LDRQLSVGDRDVAARILDCVEVVSEPEIHEGFRVALRGLPGWSADFNARVGRWFFLGFGGPSESGQVMLRMFREANRLTGKANNDLFCNLSDLASKELTADDNVVFVDDFSGTGNKSLGCGQRSKKSRQQKRSLSHRNRSHPNSGR